ncbi:hypothetical protein CORT_0C02000 [Candida orthopsilosis Co 90-125]|uniref:MINDY deubiquitinase domain-containing protein n=1 Tax=Candida orthopsilosis (strain 90-125) TaxID=1136231 RepID=H8X2M9_CANO9|nr:hypothetical protein CORT_0C02000 [Candida orthopsilosis Co 90-125]CCG25576.1 hypothetical protein CORT_0C02000 [Candida orthopsilosis Co 90-125]
MPSWTTKTGTCSPNKIMHEIAASSHKKQAVKDVLSPSELLDRNLESPQFAKFFKTNHFNTLLKKSRNELYLLITDSSFQSKRGRLVWQSLNSVSGEGDLFVNGDFMPVSDIDQDIGQEGETFNSDMMLSKQLQEEEDAALTRKMQEKYEKRNTRQSSKEPIVKKNDEAKPPSKPVEEKKKE